MNEKTAYDIAVELLEYEQIENVQADQIRITVASVPAELEGGDKSLSEDDKEAIFDAIDEAIEGTTFQYEADRGQLERHSIVGGVHNHAIARGNPEYQVSLVR